MAEQPVSSRLRELHIDRAPRVRRRTLRRALALAVLAVVALVALALILRRPPTVQVVEIREARAGEQQTELSASGYVESRRRSIIAPKIAGRLERVLVNEGDRIREGGVIAYLDDADARVALDRAEAEVLAARAQLANAAVSVELANTQLERTRRLLRAGAATREALDQAQSAWDSARAEHRAAEARLAQATEEVAAARLTLNDTVVRAPFDGTVVRKIAAEGAVLAPATFTQADLGGIIELVDLQALEVEAEVSEDQLRRIRLGMPALVFLDAFPDRVWRGEATSIRPAVDRSKAAATIKVSFLDPADSVLPGMGAKVSFLSERVPERALRSGPQRRVPAEAVVRRDGRNLVVAVEQDRVREVPVTLGQRIGDEFVLRRGPPAGTKVVAEPGNRLRAGRRVRVSAEAR